MRLLWYSPAIAVNAFSNARNSFPCDVGTRRTFAHSIDTSQAEKLPGVFAVVTGEDALRWSFPAPTVPEEWGTHCLATDKVHFVGEPVAAVAAVNRYVAEDALELIAVDYDSLPVVADATKAMDPDSPLVIEEKGTNVMLQRVFTWGEVDAAPST